MKVFEPYIVKEITLQQAKQLVALLDIKDLWNSDSTTNYPIPISDEFISNRLITISFDEIAECANYQAGYIRFYNNVKYFDKIYDCEPYYNFIQFRMYAELEFIKVAKIIGSDLNEDIC